MKTITSIPDYCKQINIPQPKYSFFDIRKFEDKVKTENSKQAPIRHEFYAIALRHAGENKSVNGQLLEANLFFNSPYQIISWDVLPDWKGWYIMFGQDFLILNPAWKNFIIEFPFFRLDKLIPFDLPPADVILANNFFEKISEEYHSDNKDKFQFIQAYTQLLLNITKRFFEKLNIDDSVSENNRTADILLVSRFQTLVETLCSQEELDTEVRQPSFYAEQLNIHPNHLNAVVKRITDKTVSQIIQQYMITFAKSLLRQTELSVKEIAYRLHFNEPTHFNAFFKKQTGFTPQQYRENTIL